jgi:hypothetical protein
MHSLQAKITSSTTYLMQPLFHTIDSSQHSLLQQHSSTSQHRQPWDEEGFRSLEPLEPRGGNRAQLLGDRLVRIPDITLCRLGALVVQKHLRASALLA